MKSCVFHITLIVDIIRNLILIQQLKSGDDDVSQKNKIATFSEREKRLKKLHNQITCMD